MNLIRVEIIGNHSLEEDLMDRLRTAFPDLKYTLVPSVQGGGTSGQRLGDGVWPEENFLLVLYLPEEDVGTVKGFLDEVRRLFPDEGLKAWTSPAGTLA